MKIIQITDTHLFSDPLGKLHGYCSHQLLSDIITHLTSIYHRDGKPDFYFLTGDISQDESIESYKLALNQLERLDAPVYWIQGNHDDRNRIKSIFNSSNNLTQLKKLVTPAWDYIAIDTCQPSKDEGYISKEEMQFFLSAVEKSKQSHKNIAIVMHHHACPVGTPLIDECILRDSYDFIRTIKSIDEIKLVICGHVHGDYRIPIGKKFIETCPATCFQWKKGTQNIETENKRGFKVFEFNSNTYESTTMLI